MNAYDYRKTMLIESLRKESTLSVFPYTKNRVATLTYCHSIHNYYRFTLQ